jgi:polysaccharide biosynthesis/export protein
MRSMQSTFRRLTRIAIILLPAAGYAQLGSSPSPDVMDVFRSMGSDQQQQVLQQLGLGTTGASGSQQAQTDSERTEREAELAAQRARLERQQREDIEARLPILRPQDSIVIEVDLLPLPPRPADTTENLYRALTLGTISAGMQIPQLGSPSAAQTPTGGISAAQLAQLSTQAGSGGLSTQQLQQLQQQYLGQQGVQPGAQLGTQLGTQLGATLPSQGIPSQDLTAPQAPGESREQPLWQGWQAGSPDLLTPLDVQRVRQLGALIRSRNPYQLDSNGILVLPGFAGIALGGLTEAQATLRLEVEPALRGLYFRVTKLPLSKTGVAGLKPFGYDLFENAPSTFAPVTNVPVPADYVMGAGDQLEVELYGNQNHSFVLTVQRDGTISFPQLGPISIAGQRFPSVKEEIESRVARQMIGVKANVTMGTTRAIRVFVLGDAEDPGTYTVSGLSTITSALYAAGGVKRVGSLRDIQLKRGGRVVQHLDLYDLLIRGDTGNDARLLPGDAIFIPPVGRTVSVEGEVHRPAIYEVNHEASIEDVVQLAGGLTPDADHIAMVTRIDPQQQRVVVRVDLASAQAGSMAVSNGDQLLVTRILPTLDSGVAVQGYLYTPETVAYRPGLRISEVIRSVDQLRPGADLHYVLIRREMPPDRHVVALSADLAAALVSPGSSADVELMPRDRITVFDLQSGRDRIIEPLLTELQVESRFGYPAQLVRVDGWVKVPGEYPLEPGMRVGDLIRAGGSLAESAYGGQAELARYEVVNGVERQTDLIRIDLAALLRGDANANIELRAFDSLSVKELSLWGQREQITLRGQVRFPGVYTIKNGETLKSVLQRAGGLTAYAFPQGSIFTRVDLKDREQQELDMLAQRTQGDITAMALQATAAGSLNGQGGSSGANALLVGQSLLTQLRATRAVGRLVIDLPRLMSEPAGSQEDVMLRNGDELIVPRFEQEVTVIGEVQSNTSHLYRKNLTSDDYIQLSGGFTTRADGGRIYIVRANGSVIPARSPHFFRVGSDGVRILPGDTIVVPMDTEKLPALPEWQAITSIIYNLAIGAAAIHAVGV